MLKEMISNTFKFKSASECTFKFVVALNTFVFEAKQCIAAYEAALKLLSFCMSS